MTKKYAHYTIVDLRIFHPEWDEEIDLSNLTISNLPRIGETIRIPSIELDTIDLIVEHVIHYTDLSNTFIICKAENDYEFKLLKKQYIEQ
jgi:hypothetical protein